MFAAAGLRLFVGIDMPLELRPWLIVDDGLFVRLAESLSNGDWLGPFDSATLVKGPGYPLFLAAAQFTSLPETLIVGLFQVFSVGVFALAVGRLTNSPRWGVAAFSVLLFFPTGLEASNNNILRGQIYPWQALLVVAMLIMAMCVAPNNKRRNRWLVASSLTFGWLWITREEGVWLVPTVSLFLAYVGYRSTGRLAARVAPAAIFAAGAALPVLAVAGMNFSAYGVFRVSDWGTKPENRILALLQSIESNKRQPYLSIPRDVREKAYGVSATLAQLQPIIDPPAPAISEWGYVGCSLYQQQPEICADHDIVSGWIPWALRLSMDRIGEYDSPQEAERFLTQIADDLHAACRSGALTCTAEAGIGGVPSLRSEDLFQIPSTVLKMLVRKVVAQTELRPSAGEEHELVAMWRFLNYPKITRYVDDGPTTAIMGWHYIRGDAFAAVTAFDSANNPVPVRVKRIAWPGVAPDDPLATHPGFQIAVGCRDDCRVRFDAPEGIIEGRLKDGAFEIDRSNAGPLSLHVHSVSAGVIRYGSTPSDLTTGIIAAANLLYANSLRISLVFGVLGLTWWSYRSLRERSLHAEAVILTALLGAGVGRLIILTLIDLTSFPGFLNSYLLPGDLLILAAGVIAAVSPARWLTGRMRSIAAGGKPAAAPP